MEQINSVLNSNKNQHKDSIFRMLFGSEKYKDNILSLFNAINGTTYSDPDDIKITTIDDALYININDYISLLLDDRVTLWEQQNSYNPNIPLQGLLCFGKLYNAYINHIAINDCRHTLINIPTPQHIVFYNGTIDQPDSKKMYLSDAFDIPVSKTSGFEWTATMININKGKQNELLKKCPVLGEYMELIERIKHNSETMSLDQAVDTAVVSCITDGILGDFLTKHRAEVLNMCLTEFNKNAFVDEE